MTYQSAAELLAESGDPAGAMTLLRKGIEKIEPRFSLSSLFQTGSMILSRQGCYAEAIELLREGMQRIPPGKWNQERVIEPALYYCLALGDRPRLDELVAATGALHDRQQVLAEVFRLQIDGCWHEAAEAAHTARLRFPRYLNLTLQEAFSRLCAGEPLQARETLDAFPGELRWNPHESIPWLAAFIELELDGPAAARPALATYLGQTEQETPVPDRSLLLRLWDQDAELHGPVPAYIFPTLPPRLTGLPQQITRMQHGGPVLGPRSSDLQETPPMQHPIHVLSVATEWWSRNGGLSTFNRDACIALAAQGVRVSCLVPETSAEELTAARETHVTLIPARSQPGLAPEQRLLLRPDLDVGDNPDWIIGHDRITGTAAQVLHDNFFPEAARAQFIHTAPGQIE